MTDDHWILTLYQRYVELYGDPAPSGPPLPVTEGTPRGEDAQPLVANSLAPHS